jgi:hypothetical protein
MSLPEVEVFDTPFADHDQVVECGACDPEYGPPESWPAWTDSLRFAHGPAITPDESWNPTDQDWQDWAAYKRECDERRFEDPAYLAWCDEQARLEEMHQASQWQDRLEQLHHVDGDQAVRDAGLPVG